MAEGHIEEGLQNMPVNDPLESLDSFLEANNVHDGWKNLILNDEKVKSGLDDARKFLEKYKSKFIPSVGKILRAFHTDFGGPDNIKAVILGHDPIPYETLATGLAFSFPADQTPTFTFPEQKSPEIVPGRAVIKFNQAVARAIAESSVSNEYMARNGILLLTAVLTVGEKGTERRGKHFEAWMSFTSSLLVRLMKKLQESHNRDLIILCWGTNAKKIGKDLRDEFPRNKENIMMDCDHPTFSENGEENNNFHTEAPKQLRRILEIYPDIFNRY